ncbi:FAD-binding oxidoreductase [Enterobacteriaceae bacterium BIT-l23]|uniref:NAD(P)/FAD-dependent oxidoreductase n=1 Tax=Jejubacter sp. L23 TaxID=3092086 RepID=UPI001585B924|nr:FAD-binding oxidoreductase [Enterobacteriaceae bacterium BIT-l23]
MNAPDVIVVGAGIVGAACAWRLTHRGLRVTLVDDGRPGATAAGMGHLVCMDDNPAELALTAWSLALWRDILPRLPDNCAWRDCGTLWLAQHPDELEEAERKRQRLADVQVASEPLCASALTAREPALGAGLAGGLWVPGDGIVYAPNVARWFIEQAGERLTHITGEVIALEEPWLQLRDGRRLRAPAILLACASGANKLLAEQWLRIKKGQLAITDRYPARLSHQLVELGYAASAHAPDGKSVAFNLQPRPTGQLLIGSSREYDNPDSQLDPVLLAAMLRRACDFLPWLADLNLIRCWSGFRSASPDGQPLLGPHPHRPGVWLALGHEGLGVTTAPGTAWLLADQITGNKPAIDAAPWLVSRLNRQEVNA